MKRTTAFLFILLAVSLGLYAQTVNPVVWTTSVSANSQTGEGVITFTADIEDGYHIYGFTQHKGGPRATSITINQTDGVATDGPLTASVDPVRKFSDQFSLNVEEWSGTITFTQHFTFHKNSTGTITGTIEYMACKGNACLPPKKETFSENIGTAIPEATEEKDSDYRTNITSTPTTTLSEPSETDWWAPVSESSESKIDRLTGDSEWWSLMIMGFLGGLFALLTPCVWPMIPITLDLFKRKSKKRYRSVLKAIFYGLSIIVIFLTFGIAITLLFGAGKLNEIANSPIFNIIFFVILVMFAISFFGAFDISLPSKWSNATDSKAERSSGLLSIFFMAFTLVIVSFSCTGPIIGTLLVEAASDESILGPSLCMGGFALGLAVPFTLFALFPPVLKEMPEAGGWMNSVKVVLGFIELILSLKYLSVADFAYGWHILDREVFLSIWIVLFTLLGFYLLGKLRFALDAVRKYTTVVGFFLAVASFSFAVYLLPGLWGAPLKAVGTLIPPLNTQDFNLYGGQFEKFTDYNEGMEYAKRNMRPVLLDFSNYTSVDCRRMEDAVFDKEKVRKPIEDHYVTIKLMVDDRTELPHPITVIENNKEVILETYGEKWTYLQKHKFNKDTQPYYVLLDNRGCLLTEPREYNEDVSAFVEWLQDGVKAYSKANPAKEEN